MLLHQTLQKISPFLIAVSACRFQDSSFCSMMPLAFIWDLNLRSFLSINVDCLSFFLPNHISSVVKY